MTSEHRDRELDLREREVAAKEREVAAKEKELQRSKWSSPIVIGLIAATLGLVGNLVVAILNNRVTQDLQRRMADSNLIIELVKTRDTETAIKNLKFFLDHGLLDDPDNRIRQALADPKTVPILPADVASHDVASYLSRLIPPLSSPAFGLLTITSDPDGAEVIIDGRTVGFTARTVVLSAGQHQVSVVLGQKRFEKLVTITKNGEHIDLHASLR